MMDDSSESLPSFWKNGKLPRLLYITKQDFTDKKHDRPLHSHDAICEILLVHSGMGVYRAGGQSYAIEEGDLIYYNPGEHHEVVTSLNHEIGTYCFGMTDFQRPGLPPNHILPPEASIIRASGTLFPCVRELCEFMYQNTNVSNQFAHTMPLMLAAFLSLVLEVKDSVPRHLQSAPEQQLAERVQRYIDKHFQEPLSLDVIAQALRCSAPYISHAFKDTIGYSPMQYMTRCRIGLAQNWLIASDYTATQIATIVGYDNTNYFNTVFTKIVGISPIKYRKKYLESMRGDRVQ